MKYIKSNKTNGWPPAVSLLPKAQMKGEKEQGAESMKHNTTLLVHHEQKPKQRKDRKYNNNIKKAGRVQGSTQKMMACPVKNPLSG